jgi:hypothetical protein
MTRRLDAAPQSVDSLRSSQTTGRVVGGRRSPYGRSLEERHSIAPWAAGPSSSWHLVEEALVTFVWFISWRIATNVGGSERPRLVR